MSRHFCNSPDEALHLKIPFLLIRQYNHCGQIEIEMDIELTLKNYRCFRDAKPAKVRLKPGFTAMVGVNNSGKSTFLKFFYEFRSLFSHLSNPGNFINSLRGVQTFDFPITIRDVNEVFCNQNDRKIEIEIQFPKVKKQGLPALEAMVISVERASNRFVSTVSASGRSIDSSKGDLDLDGDILRINQNPIATVAKALEVFKSLQNTLYIPPFRNAINIGTREDYFDIKVGQSFIELWKVSKTGSVKSLNEATNKLTKDIKAIFEFDQFEINPSDDSQTLQMFINDKSYMLSEVGSGIAQFILVLANAAFKKPSFVLIDEPELSLHPSLQLDFLTTLGSYASEGVIFATHVIGLARAAGDRIYSVKRSKELTQVTDLESTTNLAEFLGELSFAGYRDLGFDKILLVEGSTDVKTVQQFLRLYKLDHKIVILPLGGSSLIQKDSGVQLEEIKRISSNVFALIDSEKKSKADPLPTDRQQFESLCKKTKIKCHVLERRAIENYFTESTVKTIKGIKYSALQPYESLNDIPLGWSKDIDNWRIAREMSRMDLRGTDLGSFLQSL